MNAALRELGERAGAVPAPQLDVSALVAAGESRIRRRRVAAVAAVTAVVAALLSAAVLLAPGSQQTAPPPAGNDRTHAPDNGDTVETRPAARPLTYSVGTVIHWGDHTVDVGAHVSVRPPLGLGFLDVTDDGVVFATGPEVRNRGVAYDQPVPVWFTDGSTTVRIGTTAGSGVRGYGLATSPAGSTLAWREDYYRGVVVVYDTARMREVARFGGEKSYPVGEVLDNVVYWTPDARHCQPRFYLRIGPMATCGPDAPLMRFDAATGEQSEASWADYVADRRSVPGLVTTSDGDRMYVHFVVRGRELVVARPESREELAATVALTGQQLRLRLPPGLRYPEGLDLTQWLDADRVMLTGVRPYVPACSRSPGGCAWTHDDPDVLVCRLSTGSCRFIARLPDNRTTFTGEHGGRG